MDLQKLRAKRTDLANKMRAIMEVAETSALTDEQAKAFDALEAEFKQVDAQIERAEKMHGVDARLAEVRPAASAAQLGATAGGSTAGGPAVDPVRPGGPEAKQKFECFEEFLASVNDARSGGRADSRLDFRSIDLRGEQSMGTGSKGGFMVPTEFRAQLLEVDPAQTPLLGNVMRLAPGQAPDAAVTLPALDQSANQHGGVTVARIGEGAAKPETDFDLAQRTWTPKEIAGHIALTDQLIRNWSGAMGMAQRLLRGAMNAAIEDEIFRGDSPMKMKGIIASDAAYLVARQTTGRFVLADVANMVARKLQRGGAAFWLYNPLLIAELIQMKDGNDNLVWQQSLVPGAPSTLWGLPAFPYEFASDVGSLGDVALVQPNPYYVVKDGSGPFLDVGFINDDFTKNKRRVKLFMLNDGGPWLSAPFKLANGTEVSPFVVLDVPAA